MKSFISLSISLLIFALIVHAQKDNKKNELASLLASEEKDVPVDKKNITVHQLLSHSSGLPQSYVCMDMSEREDCMKAIFKERLEDPPGQVFGYSNHNFAILAGIIEVVTGKSWETYLDHNVLKVAQLNNTHFGGAIDDRNPMRVAQKINKLSKKTRQRNWDYLGGGGIYSTSLDLYRFFQAIWEDKLLSEKKTKSPFYLKSIFKKRPWNRVRLVY